MGCDGGAGVGRRRGLVAWSAVVCACLGMMVTGVTSQRIFREDRLALLSGTLKTFQEASCDGEELRLSCPAGTTVSIQLVQYGRLASKPDICGHPDDMRRFNFTDCLDRSALKVVIKACGGKQRCRLHTSSGLFGVDPCPGISKFVEVLYKCRPSEFRTKVVCEDQRRSIYCGQDRVAIYSASFGTTKEGSVHCPQQPGVRLTDCKASSFTSEKMISLCQGRSSCELHADPRQLVTRECPPGHKMYLTTKYTCVPREILRDQYDREAVDEDYQQNMTDAPPPVEVDQQASAELGAHDLPSTDHSGQAGQERLILYLTLGITVGLLLLLGVVVGRFFCRRRGKEPRPEPPPPGFGPDLSLGDSELDLGTTVLAGRLTPPHAGQRSFSSPPLAGPLADRGRPPYRDGQRLGALGALGGLGGFDSRGELPSIREARFGDNVADMESAFGDGLLAREPLYIESLRRGVKFSDAPRGRGAAYAEPPLSREPAFGDSLRGERGAATSSPVRTAPADAFYYS